MQRRILDFLMCPTTGTRLSIRAECAQGEEVIEGQLVSEAGWRYPITGGIPRLLPGAGHVAPDAQRTVDRFSDQWNEFDFMGPHYEEQFLGWIAPNRPDAFRGRTVLEGGCGKGRHSLLAARWGARDVFAIDLSHAVETTYRHTRHLRNVHVIQADLFHLPVRPQAVDVAFSVGVLHHTPNPGRCFRELVKTVRPGGRVIAWVYGRENNGWIIYGVNPLRHALTSRMPHRWVYQLSKFPALLLYAAARGVYRPFSQGPFERIGRRLFYGEYIRQLSRFPFAEVHSIVHDHLTPPIAHYIERREFERWFSALALERVTIGWHNRNSWRGTAIVNQGSARAAAASLTACELTACERT